MEPEAKLNGDAWRWNLGANGSVSRTPIGVIEPPKGVKQKEDKSKVPFGFGIREDPEWFGNPS